MKDNSVRIGSQDAITYNIVLQANRRNRDYLLHDEDKLPSYSSWEEDAK